VSGGIIAKEFWLWIYYVTWGPYEVHKT